MNNLHLKHLKALLLSALCLAVCIFMGACVTADTSSVISLHDFIKACEDDGLTVDEASSETGSGSETGSSPESDVPDYKGLETVYSARHGTEDILVQVMIFSDDQSASDAFDQYSASIDPGPSGTYTRTDNNNYTKVDSKADNRYTRVIYAGRQIISAGGPTMYESEMNRIIQKFGYQ